MALADLAVLEPALVRAASLDDPAAEWLAAGLCRTLQRAGAIRLRDVVQLANLHGFHWHRQVPGLGAVRARRLLQWLGPLAEAQGLPLRDSCLRAGLRPAGAAAPGGCGCRVGRGPRPGPWLRPGCRGRRARPQPGGPARSDLEAIATWAQRFQGRTRLDHQRIAQRFLRWCTQVRRLQGLAAVGEADLLAYQAFIAAPPPDWVQPGRLARDDPDWRPFRGPLSPGSRRRECAVLASLFAALHAAGRLPQAAWRAARRPTCPPRW